MTKACCACPGCRREIRAEILRVFDRERRWLGPYTIKSYGFARVPNGLFFEILAEMVKGDDAPLILCKGDGEPFPRMLPSRLMSRPSSMLMVREGGENVA